MFINSLINSFHFIQKFRFTSVPKHLPHVLVLSLSPQMIEEIFNPSRPELSDISHHSYGLTDKLMSSIRLVYHISIYVNAWAFT